MPQQNIYNLHLIENGDMSGNLETQIVDLSRTTGFAITIVVAGTPEGTIHIEMGNNDRLTDLFIDPNSIVNIDGPIRIAYEKEINNFDKVKVVYTSTSGTGTLNIYMNGKGNN